MLPYSNVLIARYYKVQLQSSMLLVQLAAKWTPIFMLRTEFWVRQEAFWISQKLLFLFIFFSFCNLLHMGFPTAPYFFVMLLPQARFWVRHVIFLIFEISWVFQFYMPQCCWLGVPVVFGFKVLPQSCGYLLYNVWRHILDRFGQKSWMKGWPLMRFYPNWNWGLFARWWEANYLILNFVNS